MYYTKEYTKLITPDGGEIKLLPNVMFAPFEGEFTVTCSARILNKEDNSFYRQLSPGEKITGIGEMPKPKRKRKKKVAEESEDE